MKNKKGNAILIPLIIIIAVITSATLWYLFAKKSQTNGSKVASDSQSLPNETGNWKTYSSDNLKISFQFPEGWFIKEDESINRIYIKNTPLDVSKGNIPVDFQQVIISTWIQEATKQRENNTKNGHPDCCDIKNASGNFVESNDKVDFGYIKNNNLLIKTYEFTSGGGPKMEAYWEDNLGKIYFASNSSEVGNENQHKMIENLKKILATIKFIN